MVRSTPTDRPCQAKADVRYADSRAVCLQRKPYLAVRRGALPKRTLICARCVRFGRDAPRSVQMRARCASLPSCVRRRLGNERASKRTSARPVMSCFMTSRPSRCSSAFVLSLNHRCLHFVIACLRLACVFFLFSHFRSCAGRSARNLAGIGRAAWTGVLSRRSNGCQFESVARKTRVWGRPIEVVLDRREICRPARLTGHADCQPLTLL